MTLEQRGKISLLAERHEALQELGIGAWLIRLHRLERLQVASDGRHWLGLHGNVPPGS